MKRLRVLVLVHPDLIPPESTKGFSEQEINDWKTEYDVVTTLRTAGHEVRFACQPKFASVVTQAGLTAVPAGRDGDLWDLIPRHPDYRGTTIETVSCLSAGSIHSDIRDHDGPRRVHILDYQLSRDRPALYQA